MFAKAKVISQFVPYLTDFIKLKITYYFLRIGKVPEVNGMSFLEIQLLKTKEMTSNKGLQVFFFSYMFTHSSKFYV